MGIRTRLAPGGRCVLASMRTTGRPLETLTGSLSISEVVFATAGNDRIKCLRPRALFSLPLIHMADCKSASSIASKIRAAWASHMNTIQAAESWLRDVGADVSASADGANLSVSIAGESQHVKVQVCEARKVILPSCGPLTGVALKRPGDRVLDIDPCLDSAIDLEIDISTRMAELSNMDRRLKEEERRVAMSKPASPLQDDGRKPQRPSRVMLVGENLSKERSCIDSLRLRNYEVQTARTLHEAIDTYNRMSPELVFADVNLGRSEGIDLIPSLREVVGIEEIPVIVVDHQRHNNRRKAARQAGAIGYLTYPIDISRISSHLEETIRKPKRRRFTRYSDRLAVNVSGSSRAATTVVIGRGGLMLRSDEDFPINSIQSCNVALPAIGKSLEFDAEVVYRVRDRGERCVGLRFLSMANESESSLIDYLHHLH